ncbi:MAG: hypothetical protein LEGION0398_MBIBDBAK_01372 [Legionellaceae bacterium]
MIELTAINYFRKSENLSHVPKKDLNKNWIIFLSKNEDVIKNNIDFFKEIFVKVLPELLFSSDEVKKRKNNSSKEVINSTTEQGNSKQSSSNNKLSVEQKIERKKTELETKISNASSYKDLKKILNNYSPVHQCKEKVNKKEIVIFSGDFGTIQEKICKECELKQSPALVSKEPIVSENDNKKRIQRPLFFSEPANEKQSYRSILNPVVSSNPEEQKTEIKESKGNHDLKPILKKAKKSDKTSHTDLKPVEANVLGWPLMFLGGLTIIAAITVLLATAGTFTLPLAGALLVMGGISLTFGFMAIDKPATMQFASYSNMSAPPIVHQTSKKTMVPESVNLKKNENENEIGKSSGNPAAEEIIIEEASEEIKQTGLKKGVTFQ